MTRFLARSLIVAALASAAGCAVPTGEQQEPVDNVAEGLVLDVDAVRPERIVGTFRKGQDMLRIEVLVGERNPGHDPQAPTHAVDIRIADQDGLVFFLQQGGDKLQDPTWEQDLEAPADLTRRFRAWELVKELSDELARPEQQKLQNVSMPAFKALDTLSRTQKLPRPVVEDARDITPAEMRGQASFRHGFSIAKGNIAGGLGHHTATWVTVEYGTGMVSQRSNCNHGRCWDDYANGMRLTCSRSLSTTSSSLRANTTCSTAYSWNSGSGHNCHDDTRIQNRSWYHNTSYGTTSSNWINYCASNNHVYDTIYAPPCYP